MSAFEIEMKHDGDSLVRLSRMQYDLFCTRNRIARTLIAGIAVIFGVRSYENWWGILIIAYGCYLITSTYSSSDRTAHKLTAQIEASGKGFPHSRYIFESNAMRIILLPEKTEADPLAYSDIRRIGEDRTAFYIFRDEYGGYVIPKNALGSKVESFRQFIQSKADQRIMSRRSLLDRLNASKPYGDRLR